ncbi:MAG: trypsin-like peptidase domain-containing protein [Rickettsiaceae bacterium]
MLKIIKIFLVSLILTNGAYASNTAKIKDLEKIKQAIVTINSRVPVSAYQNTGSWSGTGFIANLEKGFIITNNHVVGRAAVGTYFITFHNGQQAEAKVAYYDQYADFAILKINPEELPSQVNKIEFSSTKPTLGDEVFIVGNTEDQGFSFHNGYLSDLFDISGQMPQGSYVINMNTTGGASGSPVINADNKAIGVLYGGGKTHALALKSSYVTDVLNALKDNKLPQRKHIGIISSLYSLDKAVKHRNFPTLEMNSYINKFPDARNRIITARSVIAGSTAQNIIMPGDIIWAVNDKELGGDLTILDQTMNNAQNSIVLTIFRNGQKLNKEIKLYDLEKTKIFKMLDFAGAIFFEVDDYAAAKSGIPLGSIAIANVQTGSSFSSIPEMFIQNYKSVYRLVVESMNNKKIKTLDDLAKVVNNAIKQKFINITYKNYQPYFTAFDQESGFISSQEHLMQDITFDSIDTKPRILRYDQILNEWISEEI